MDQNPPLTIPPARTAAGATSRPALGTAPGSRAMAAAVRLLADPSPAVSRSCTTTVLAWGESAREFLEAAEHDDDPRLRCEVRRLLRTLDLRRAAHDFGVTIDAARRGVDPRGVLEAGLQALHGLVRLQRTGHGPGRYARRFDEIADELAPLVRGRTPATAARHLADVLGGRHSLRGCRSSLLKSREELLPTRVLERGRGTAAALAAIYLLVARRAGLDATLVSLPDYFLVRLHGRRRVLIDPSRGGRTVTRADCLRYLRTRGDAEVGLHRLVDVDDSQLLVGLVEDLLDVREVCCDPALTGGLLRALDALRSREPLIEIPRP